MNTTELIELLQEHEFGASGRPREISFATLGGYHAEPDISLNSTGDGIAGAEICLSLTSGKLYKESEEE